jgi:NAD(P)-dependent dehydrogenase (short-subunit alcohol dehydrogenase family)
MAAIRAGEEGVMRLSGKVAIITGGARGIGAAIAERYVEEGAVVVIADRDGAAAQALAARLGHGAMGLACDVTRAEDIAALVRETVAAKGGIDILVNNAAVFDLAPVLETTRESYRRVFAVNVEGMIFTLQAVARQMVAQGRGGKIINFASQAGRRGEALVGIYCASKAAVISYTQSAALDLIKYRINVNAISPGVVDTPMWDQVDALFAKYENLPIGEKKRRVGAAVPYGRMGKPEDLTGMAVFLASPDADYIVGQTYNVDGGNCLN